MGVKTRISNARGGKNKVIKVAFAEFLHEKIATGKSASTQRNYLQSYEYFIAFNSYQWNADTDYCTVITEADVKNWMLNMALDGVKDTTINHYVRDVRVFLYWCMDRGYIKEPFTIELRKTQETGIKHFTEAEVEVLLKKPKPEASFVTWRTWAIINYVMATGNRASTICNVKLRDIDFDNRYITLTHTKSKKLYTIPLSTSLYMVLQEYIDMWIDTEDLNGWLFPTIAAEELNPNALAHSFSKYCKDRGLTRTSIHGLRHTFARMYLLNDGNMFKLQKMLGHATLEMTRKYVRLFVDDLSEDFDEISPLDSIKSKATRKAIIQRKR